MTEDQREKQRGYSRAWRKANPGENRAYQRAYREANREKLAAYQRALRAAGGVKVEQKRARDRERYWEAPEKHRGKVRAYHKANAEKECEISRAYYASTAGKEWHRAYREENRAQLRERNRAYRQANPDKGRETARRREARKRENHAVPYTEQEVFENDNFICQYEDCDFPTQEIDTTLPRNDPSGLTLDHIFPVGRGGADAAWNAQTMHRRCNERKGVRVPDDALKRQVLNWLRGLENASAGITEGAEAHG